MTKDSVFKSLLQAQDQVLLAVYADKALIILSYARSEKAQGVDIKVIFDTTNATREELDIIEKIRAYEFDIIIGPVDEEFVVVDDISPEWCELENKLFKLQPASV